MVSTHRVLHLLHRRGTKCWKYAFTPSVFHLRHPLSRYVSIWEFILEGGEVTVELYIGPG